MSKAPISMSATGHLRKIGLMSDKDLTGIRTAAGNDDPRWDLRQISRVRTLRGIVEVRRSLSGGFQTIRQGLECLNWSRPLGLPDWITPPSRAHGEVGTCGARSCLALRLVTFPPRYRSALEPSGELTPTWLARIGEAAMTGALNDLLLILVFGRVRYRGCDCGRDHTDLM